MEVILYKEEVRGLVVVTMKKNEYDFLLYPKTILDLYRSYEKVFENERIIGEYPSLFSGHKKKEASGFLLYYK